MDILDSPDVVNRIDINAPAQGLALHIANQMAMGAGGIDAVVGIQQFDAEHGCHYFRASGVASGYGCWRLVRVLIRVKNHDPFERGIIRQRNKRLAGFASPTLCYQ